MTARQAEQHYDFDINSQQDLNEINRLQKTHGVDTVRKWHHEGMPRDVMGVPKEMKQFYETDSTQQQPTPVQRSPDTDTGSVQIELRPTPKKETIKNLSDLKRELKHSKLGQFFRGLNPGSKKGLKHPTPPVNDPAPQPGQQDMYRAATIPGPTGNQSADTIFPNPTTLAGSISAGDLPSWMVTHGSEHGPSSSSMIPENGSEHGYTPSSRISELGSVFETPSSSSTERPVRDPLPPLQGNGTPESLLSHPLTSVSGGTGPNRGDQYIFPHNVNTSEIEPAPLQSPHTQLCESSTVTNGESDQEQYFTELLNEQLSQTYPPSQPSLEDETALQQRAVDSLNSIEIPPGRPASRYIPGKYVPTVDRSVDETKQKARAYAERLGITTSEPNVAGIATGSAKRARMSNGFPGAKHVTLRSRVDPEMRKKRELVDAEKLAGLNNIIYTTDEWEKIKSRKQKIETANRSNVAKMNKRKTQLEAHVGTPTIAENRKTEAENKQEAITKSQDEIIDAKFRTNAAFFDALHAEKNGSSKAIKTKNGRYQEAKAEEKQIKKTNQKPISNYIKAKSELEHPWGPRVALRCEIEKRNRTRKAVQSDNTVYGQTFVSYFSGGKQLRRDGNRTIAKQCMLATGLFPVGNALSVLL
jgi:hypothetical protein